MFIYHSFAHYNQGSLQTRTSYLSRTWYSFCASLVPIIQPMILNRLFFSILQQQQEFVSVLHIQLWGLEFNLWINKTRNCLLYPFTEQCEREWTWQNESVNLITAYLEKLYHLLSSLGTYLV